MQCLPCLIIFTEISTSITFRLFFTFIGTDPNVLITTRSTFVTSSHFSNLSHKILLNFPIFLFSHPSILWNCHIYNLTVLVCLLNEHYIINRVVTKISSCRVNTTSRRGIKRLGISFGSIFFHFPIKVAGVHSLSSRGKSPAPGSS